MTRTMLLLCVILGTVLLAPVSPAVAASPVPSLGTCPAPRVKERPLPTLGEEGADTSNQGNGSFRLCLDGAPPVAGRAWCIWTEDRSAVIGASIDRREPDGSLMDLYLRAATSLGSDPDADHRLGLSFGRRSYATDAGGTIAVTGSLGDGWLVTFRAPRVGHPDVAVRVGSLGLRCGEPPPMEPGQSVGRVSFRLSDDPNRVFETSAVCRWADWERHSTVVAVHGTDTRAKVADGRFIGLDLDLANGQGRSVTVRVDYTPPFDLNGPSMVDSRFAYPLWTPADRQSGTVRAHHLVPEDIWESGEAVPGDPSSLGLVASWECDDPPDDLDWDDQSNHIDWPAWHGRPGLVTLRGPWLPGGAITVAASCGASEDDDDDPPQTLIDSVAAAFELDGHQAILIGDASGFVALYLRGADGRLDGDLTWGPMLDETWDGGGDGRTDISPLTLTRSALTLDPIVPESLPITMTWDCPPGLDVLS